MRPTGIEDVEALLERLDVLSGTREGLAPVSDEVCREATFELVFNGRIVGRLVASPAQLEELGAGFVVSEGLARRVTKVRVVAERIIVTGEALGRYGGTVTGSGGGLSTTRVLRPVSSQLVVGAGDIFRVSEEIVSPLWERTGGAHCSVLYSGGEVVARSSDVGRHNTVDKVIGACVLAGADLSCCVLGCTGRQPAGMVAKAVNANIPVIVSKAATTDEGVRLARAYGLTLVCRVRDGSFKVYTHPARVGGTTVRGGLREDGWHAGGRVHGCR